MTAKILDGKEVAAKIRIELKKEVEKLDVKPGLGVILAGNNAASAVYVKGKIKACEEVGMVSKKVEVDSNISHDDLFKLVDELNQDKSIHGFIVQLPLPEQINYNSIIDGILPSKDADGFTPINIGNLALGKDAIIAATPKGIIRLLKEYNIDLEGKHAVVIGRSNIVGKPVALLLLAEHCTVTICHSKTQNLKKICKESDIIIAAIGKPKFITKDMVKHGAIVIDVGINKTDDGICGDVDFENVKKVAGYITPVPGGVGPMTIAMLLENTLECYKKGLM